MKNRYKFAASIIASLLMASVAQANAPIKNANNQIAVSFGAHDLDYNELDEHNIADGKSLNSENGKQPAIKVSYTTQRDIFGIKDAYLATSIAFAHGDTDYVGYLQGGGALIPFKNTTRSTTTDLNVRVGKGFTFASAPDVQVTPFIGLGYQLWVRDMQGEFGYKEDYSHISYEAGVLAQYAVTPKIVASFDVSTGRTSNSKMTAYLDEDVKFKMTNDTRTSIGIGADYAYSDKIHFSAGYRVTKFRYGESPAVGEFLEPSSKTTTQELTAGIGFQF